VKSINSVILTETALSELLRSGNKEVNILRCSVVSKTRTPDMEAKSARESAASVRF